MDWETAARRVRQEVDFSRISSRMLQDIGSAEPLNVACSGGADSVFALLLVRAVLEQSGRVSQLKVLHFNHALRGEDSDEDAAFVGELCRSLRIPFLNAKAEWDIELDRVNEAEARAARLAFFRAATSANGENTRWIVTGHHAGDVAESILMRLSRGAGADGLCAPRERSTAGGGLCFLRPLLGFSREEIQAILESAGAAWRDDASNDSDKNYRARIRAEVTPAWQKVADRELLPGVLRSRSLLEEDAVALESWTERAWAQAWDEESGSIDRKLLASCPRAIQRRVLNRFKEGSEASAAVVENLLMALANAEDVDFSLGVDCRIILDGKSLRIVRSSTEAGAAWPEFRLPTGCIAFLPDGGRLSVSRFLKAEMDWSPEKLAVNDDSRAAWISEGGNHIGAVVVRRRQAGDAFKPLGKSSEKKLKTLLIERKVPRQIRDLLPVFVFSGEGIVWMPGLPPSAERKLGSETESALRLTYGR